MGRKQQLIGLIESDSLLYTGVGMALKVVFEWATIAVTLLPIVFVLSFVVDGVTMTLQPSPKSSVAIWAGLTVAVFKTTWCFTKRGTVET